MLLKAMATSALMISAYLSGSAGSAASAAGKTSLIGSGGVQGLMEQQSACAVPEKSTRPWEFKAGQKPYSVAFSPDGKLLAVANFGSQSVSMYEVQDNGTLKAVGSPFATEKDPISVAFSPDGKLLAVANRRSDNVSEYHVQDNGMLEAAVGSPFKTGMFSTSVAFSPDGTLLAVANQGSASLSVYRVQDNDGTLKAKSSVATGNKPASIAFSPDGNLLAVANHGDGTVWMYEVDPDTSAISPITGNALKATKKREKEYQEAHKVLVEPIPSILPQAVVENVLQEFIVGPQPVKKQEKQDKDSKESDDVIQQKIKRTQEQETLRKEDQEKLFEAIKRGDANEVAQYLTPFTINAINEKDEFRGTPLLAATRLNNAAIVKKILDYRGEIVRADKVPYPSAANLMAQDKNDNSALLLAILNHDDYKIAIMIAEKMTSEERKKPIKKDGAPAIVYVEQFQKKDANKADYERLRALLQK